MPAAPAQADPSAPVATTTNYTGQPAFTLADLEEFGFPWGMTLSEALDRHSDELFSGRTPDGMHIRTNSDQVRRWFNDARREAEQIDYIPSWLVTFNIRDGDTDVGSVFFGMEELIEEFSFSERRPGVGPRGVRPGMTFYEALNLFRVDNYEALELARNLVPGTPFEQRGSIRLYTEGHPQNSGRARYSGDIHFTDNIIILTYFVRNDNGQEIVRMELYTWAYNGVNGIISNMRIMYFN